MAAGNKIFEFIAREYQPTASNPAIPDIRNAHEVLDFDVTTQESAVFSGYFSENYGGGNLSFVADIAMSSATSGTAGLLVVLESVSGQDIDSDGFATTMTVTAATVAGTAGTVFQLARTLTAANLDSLAAKNPFRIKISRDVLNDNAAGDLELWGCYAVES